MTTKQSRYTLLYGYNGIRRHKNNLVWQQILTDGAGFSSSVTVPQVNFERKTPAHILFFFSSFGM